jgi:2,4-diacetamido-2,4,6-trideoxy-beta-L-gulose transferase
MEDNHITVIAEAGVNHNGDPAIAMELIDVAAAAGADIVKFQTFKAANLLVKNAEKAEYQKKTSGDHENQFEMLQKLELSYEVHFQLASHCAKRNIQFLSTAFDEESLQFLVESLQLRCLKIPSGEITNGPFLLKHAQSGCDLILSTGMSTLHEIKEALSVLAFGFLGHDAPSTMAFRDAYGSPEGKRILQEKVTLLHCTTNYPAPYEDINLRAIRTLKEVFGMKVGFSDHSQGVIVPLIATGLGTCIIEKHFTLDRKMPGPDHVASLDPAELRQMIREIRIGEKTLGNGKKEPQPSEIPNISVARKSLVAGREIKKNELFNEKNLISKRPGSGISPMKYWNVLNTPSNSNYKADDLIQAP